MRVAATLAAAALGLGLAACGGDDDNGGQLSAASVREAGLKYAKCMRNHGFDVPDPKPGAAGLRGLMVDDELRDRPGYKDAEQDCRRHLSGLVAQISDEQRAELQDARLGFARCMRDQGFDVPDPQPGQGPDSQGGLGDLDFDDPRVADAMDKCRGELPQLKSDAR